MLSARQIVRGALLKTAPGALVGFAILVGASSFARSEISVGRIGTSIAGAAAIAVGSALVLLVSRRRLRADAGVDGRRAFIAGLASLALGLTLRPFVGAIGMFGEYALMAASGALVSTAMFWPWIRGRIVRPEEIIAEQERV